MKQIENGRIIFSVLVGSRAYGTHSEESDYDYKHVYVQDPLDVLINGYEDQINFNKDDVAYELKRFVELVKSSNPTIIEMLFSPVENILFIDDLFQPFIDNCESFLSKKCYLSFGGFADSQIKKAKGTNKKMNWENNKVTRKTVEDFCTVSLGQGKTMPLKKWNKYYDISEMGLTKLPNIRDGYAVFYDESFKGLCDEKSNDVRLSSIPKEKLDTYLCDIFFNKDAYSQHCKDYREYQSWLKNRNTQRYVDIDNHGQKIDGKNMLHCMRMVTMSNEILSGKGVIVKRPDSDYLLDIRHGKYDLNFIIEKCEEIMADNKRLFKENILPNDIDHELLGELYKGVRKKIFKNINRLR